MTTTPLEPPRSLDPAERQPATPHRLIDRFVPVAQVREAHHIRVRAPADLVMRAAEDFDMMDIPIVFAIFWLRSRIMRAPPPPRDHPEGLLDATRRMGWVELARRPGRELVMGAAVQPWLPEPVFKPVAPDRFATYAEPDHVTIAWTLEVEPLGPDLTMFRTETRVQPTDASARRRFRWYWLRAGLGIVLIRRLMVRAVRRHAERLARSSSRQLHSSG
jgi:hypothetical protein